MKKTILFAATILLALPAFSLSGILISPKPGVTVDQLSQDAINAVAQHASEFYAELVGKAQKQYEDTVAHLKSKNTDKSGEWLNRQVAKAVKRREAAYQSAKMETACHAQAECKNLCIAEVEGVSSEKCPEPGID